MLIHHIIIACCGRRRHTHTHICTHVCTNTQTRTRTHTHENQLHIHSGFPVTSRNTYFCPCQGLRQACAQTAELPSVMHIFSEIVFFFLKDYSLTFRLSFLLTKYLLTYSMYFILIYKDASPVRCHFAGAEIQGQCRCLHFL